MSIVLMSCLLLYPYKGDLFKSILLVSISTREVCSNLFSLSQFLHERFVYIYSPRLYFYARDSFISILLVSISPREKFGKVPGAPVLW